MFFKIADLWSLSTDQQIVLLGSPGRSTFFKWKKEGGILSTDTQERISHVVSIFKALQILFENAKQADGWLHRPNRYWDGRSGIDVMLEGKLTDIYQVRAYLDAQRGG
jgi:uncharacterized protein (DUF2384 family)